MHIGAKMHQMHPRSYAYRVDSGNGTLVLCDKHLDLRRGEGEKWVLTGEMLAVNLCDDCEDEDEE